jgi:nitrous oxide reductase accessory protein NosL
MMQPAHTRRRLLAIAAIALLPACTSAEDTADAGPAEPTDVAMDGRAGSEVTEAACDGLLAGFDGDLTLLAA